MNRNVGDLDALFRIAIGVVLLAYASTTILPALTGYLPGAAGIGAWAWLGWIGVVPVATGIAGTCPAYSMMGISTCRTR